MSELKIYKTKLSPEMNAQVDSISSYLGSLTPTLTTNCQYQKVELDMAIKLVLTQDKQTTAIGNYLDLYQDNKHFYFFIMGATWQAKNTVELQLSLDTINTFNGDFTFTNKTHIIREHKNRFSNTTSLSVGSNRLYEVVDDTDEGVSGAVQYKKSDEIIYHGNAYLNQKWYLVYQSLNNTDTSGIDVELLPNEKIPVSLSSGYIKYTPAQLDSSYYYYLFIQDNQQSMVSITYQNPHGSGHITRTLGEQLENGYTIYGFRYHKVRQSGVDKIEVVMCAKNSNDEYIWTVANTSSASITFTTKSSRTLYRRYGQISANVEEILNMSLSTVTMADMGGTYTREIGNISRTEQKLVKIIELAYCPVNITWDEDMCIQFPTNEGWSIDANGRIIPSLTTEFHASIVENKSFELYDDITIAEQTHALIPTLPRGYISDPKLKHSSLYTYKFLYDSYSMPISLEKITQNRDIFDEYGAYNIEYKAANTINSNCGFRLDTVNCEYKDNADYGNYLISTRSLESPIYTNAYINYMRNGYNYDKKAKNTQEATTWVGAGVQLVGGVVATVLGAGAGGIGAVAGAALITSGIATLSNAITTSISAEQSLAEKLDNARNQAASVNGCDDLNLLNWYNGNKLHLVQYQVSDKLRKLMDDTFYYCGYASERYAIPTTYKRIWFDYIQCEPVFAEEQTSIYQEFLKDIKARYAAGVTRFHNHYGEYNFERTYENWESVLVDW